MTKPAGVPRWTCFWAGLVAVALGCAPSHVELGMQALARGDDSEAERQLGMAVAHQPDDAEAWRELARVRFRKGVHDQAAMAVAEAESIRPGDPATRLLRGQIRLALGERDASLEDALFAAKRSRRPSELQQAAILLLRLHAPEPAFVAARQAVEASRGDPVAYANLAVLGDEAGRPEVVERAFAEGRRLHPEHVGLAQAEAAWLTKQGRYADARRAYLALLKLHPQPGLVHLALALLFHQDGQLAQARLHAQKAVEDLGDQRADVHYTHVVVMLDSGKQEEARQALARARRRFPGDRDLARLDAMLRQ